MKALKTLKISLLSEIADGNLVNSSLKHLSVYLRNDDKLNECLKKFMTLETLEARGYQITDWNFLKPVLKNLLIKTNHSFPPTAIWKTLLGIETLSLECNSIEELGFLSDFPSLSQLIIKNNGYMTSEI